jgi:cellulose synthase/poly-beta-1,6-N-acetylglucosamine synthase-like glycosyltransferase
MDAFRIAIACVFWICAGCVFYAYIGYPFVIWCLSRLFGRRLQAPVGGEEDLPTVSLLIAAHNEEAVIGERLRNALAMDYPADKLEIVVASDGSTDATAEIVRRYADDGVRLLAYELRRGKAAVLNAALPELTGKIIMLSDANTYTEPSAARRIVRWFREPGVGVVCGRLVLTDPATGHNVDSLYWKYETFLKKCDGRLGALLGANGAIYALRRECYTRIPNDTIVDDLVIPLLAKLRTGCTIVYDWEAVAREETPANLGSEFHRRARIGAGGFQSIGILWRLLDPRRGWIAFTFFSHKVLRWLCPFFLLGLLASNLALWEETLYRSALIGQLGFYGVSLLGAVVPGRLKSLKPLRLTTMFTGMNAALLVGFCRWLRGTQKGVWKRTARAAGMAAVGRRHPELDLPAAAGTKPGLAP